MKILTTQDLKDKFGISNDSELAGFFEVAPSAICKWRGVVPASRVFQLQKEYPGEFGEYQVEYFQGPRGMQWGYRE